MAHAVWKNLGTILSPVEYGNDSDKHEPHQQKVMKIHNLASHQLS